MLMGTEEFVEVSYRKYIFNDEDFIVRQDFWDAFDACPNAIEVFGWETSFGVGTNDATLNGKLGAIWSKADAFGEKMLVSTANMIVN